PPPVSPRAAPSGERLPTGPYPGCHAGLVQGFDNGLLVSIRHLMEERQDDRVILGPLAVAQSGTHPGRAITRRLSRAARPGSSGIHGFAVSTHNPAPGRNAGIQHRLHHILLVASFREANTEALPIAACPSRLLGQPHAGDSTQQGPVSVGEKTAA